VDTPLQITPILIQGGSPEGVTPFVDGPGTQQSRLHPRGKQRLPRLDGNLTGPELLGQTHLPWLGWVVLVRTRAVGAPYRRSMVTQDLVDDPVAPARTNHLHTDRGMLKDPCPLGASVHPCAGFITADQPAAAQRVRISSTRWSRRIVTNGKRFAKAPSLIATPYTCATRAERRSSLMAWGERRAVARR
jgi:hypothetical protein